MAKYWFGSLEQIEHQHVVDKDLNPTTLKPVKGWKAEAADYPTQTDKDAARAVVGERWWAEAIAEGYDRDSGDVQLRITLVDVPDDKQDGGKGKKP